MQNIQAEIEKLEKTIEENQRMLEQMKLEMTLFEQSAVKDQYGTILAYVNCHI